ncbi:DUF2267 domain-containing protein [Candidatus Parcubacteria bacterium]|nr:MAG: DUF2267 domain-containing protein [Candidatus Parcubacteria bacterium]
MEAKEHVHVFDTTLQKTNEILKDIEDYFGWKDRNKAYLALRVVLHTLRDRLPVEAAAAFGAQLPMLVKGFYYDGWKPSAAPLKMSKAEFIGEIERQIDPLSFEQKTENIVKGILEVIEKHIEPAEIKKIKNLLPKDIREMLA